MNTTPCLARRERTLIPPSLDPATDAYLLKVAEEHRRFLAVLAELNSLEQTGSLARIAAVQGRLTQEFLDAQRSIMRRRAETAAEIDCIAAKADADVQRLCEQATAGIDRYPGVIRLLPPTGWPVPLAAPSSTARVTVNPPAVDVVALAQMVDGAFAPPEPDGVAMKRQLRAVLDEWWRSEKQEAEAAIDDAHARAAMQVHVARVEAARTLDLDGPLLGGVHDPGDQSLPAPLLPAPLLPAPPRLAQPPLPPLVTALDATRHEDLDDLLVSLLHALDGDAPTNSGSSESEGPSSHDHGQSDTSAAPMSLTDDSTAQVAASQEAFDRFWGAVTLRRTGARNWLVSQIMVPAVVAVAVLALVLAVVG